MRQFTARAYNNFKVDKLRSILDKSSDTQRLSDEIDYYKEVHKTPLSCFFPRLFFSKQGVNNTLTLEYYGYDNLANYSGDWGNVASKLDSVLDIYHSMEDKSLSGNEVVAYKRQMYTDKTLNYHNELINDFDFFKSLNKNKKILVNKKELYSFSFIWEDIVELINKTLLNPRPFSIIHGDMCFSNILYDEARDIIKFIDPRGSFGKKHIYGDPLYDIAKLMHSFSGFYEYIIYDNFSCKYEGNCIEFEFENNSLHKAQKIFKSYGRFNDKQAKLIEGLIFIGMCSRHYDSEERQVVMYATGLKILNDILDDEHMC